MELLGFVLSCFAGEREEVSLLQKVESQFISACALLAKCRPLGLIVPVARASVAPPRNALRGLGHGTQKIMTYKLNHCVEVRRECSGVSDSIYSGF